MTDANISAIRAKLRFDHIDDFIQGYSQYVSTAGLFIPMAPEKFKPMDSVVRFQFLLSDGATTALLGEGSVVHHQHLDPATPDTPTGILVKFNKLSPSSKQTVERIVRMQAARQSAPFIALSEPPPPPAIKAAAPAPEPEPEPHQEPELEPEPPVTPEPEPSEPSAPSAPVLSEPSEPVIEPPQLEPPLERLSPPAQHDDPLADLFADDDEDDVAHASPPNAASQPELGAFASQGSLGGGPSEGSRQPKTLGQTERGIQIMAYDQATEQANVDLAALVGGSDDDDFDSMFDDIFGGPSHPKEVAPQPPSPQRAAPSFLSGPVAAVSREPAIADPAPSTPSGPPSNSKELLGLLGSLERSEPQEVAPSLAALDLQAADAARIKPETPLEGSLESLLAQARKDLETPPEKKSTRDILDDLLGDDLPPPPEADEAFSLPPSPAEANKDKKQGGFFSRLFGGNNDK